MIHSTYEYWRAIGQLLWYSYNTQRKNGGFYAGKATLEGNEFSSAIIAERNKYLMQARLQQVFNPELDSQQTHTDWIN